LDEFGNLLGPSVTGDITGAEKTVNGATTEVTKVTNGGKSLANPYNVTYDKAAEDRAKPTNKSSVPPK